MLSTVKNRSLFPCSLIQECILLRIEGKGLDEIKKHISTEYNITVGRRTIQTWLKEWRKNSQECELFPWEEVIGILVKIDKSGSERKLTIYCNRMLFVIAVPKEYAKCSKHLGKRIIVIKTDISEKPFIIRMANKNVAISHFFISVREFFSRGF
jgi:hypothetical protein